MPNLIRPEGPEPDDFRFSRRALATGLAGGLAFAGYAPAALARQAAPITTGGEGLTQEQVTVEAPDGFALPIFVARRRGGTLACGGGRIRDFRCPRIHP